MTSSHKDAAKDAVGRAAASMVESDMLVGLGTGSTAAAALRALGRRVREEGLKIAGVPTSFASERLARECGIPLVSVDEVDRLDIAMDGADEIDPMLNLIKGRGGAHAREKVIAAMADQFIALGDPSKLVDRLGSKAPVPIEVMPMAVRSVMRSLEQLGAVPVLRTGLRKDGPVVTDQGLWLIDARFGPIPDPEALNRTLHALPGVLDHGLFLGIATLALVGAPDGSVRRLEPADVLPPVG